MADTGAAPLERLFTCSVYGMRAFEFLYYIMMVFLCVNGRMSDPQRVSYDTENQPYEIKGLRVAEISLIIDP